MAPSTPQAHREVCDQDLVIVDHVHVWEICGECVSVVLEIASRK